MRSGTYALASVILHTGDKVDAGHFVAICARGEDRSVECNDASVREVSAASLHQHAVRRDAYVLVYVRADHSGKQASDGSDRTPYTRDERSVEMC